MTTLLIIESPGKKATLEKILGPDYVVRASYGHIRDLPAKGYGLKAPDFRLNYQVSDDRAQGTVTALKKAASTATRVLLATDPDREGEAIAWHLGQVLGLKSPQRVSYQEITPNAVREAVAKPRPLNMALVHAQECRRGVDRIIGWDASAALSGKLGKTVSAGRVQSPAVRIVVDREREIHAFKPTDHFGADLSFAGPSGSWKASWKPELPEGETYQLDRSLAERVAGVRHLEVTTFADTKTRKAPPPPFITSTLQRAAQVVLKIKPKQTMEIAQKLYEQGLITYMRTDTPNLSGDAHVQIAAYAAANQLAMHTERRTWKSKAGAQEAHEAIRPTHIAEEQGGTTAQERDLYRLIWTRAVASQLADAIYAVRTTTLKATDQDVAFQARGRALIEPGWKTLGAEAKEDEPVGGDDEEKAEATNPIPALTVGQALTATSGSLVAKRTKAPARYTLASLGAALESHGIGRPATYASILETITTGRGYVLEDKAGFLSPTATAEAMVDQLVGTFRFVDLPYTRDLETQLDDIAAGQRSYVDVVASVDAILANEIGALGPGQIHPCPECGEPLRRRTGGKGPFWGCSGYPKCTVTRPDDGGSPGERKAPADTGSGHQCPVCSHALKRLVMSKKDDPKKRGYDFFVCTATTCKKTFNPDRAGRPIFTQPSKEKAS